jgi:NADPH:quinone reductase-like Zn-dependent oxidoreductase
VDVAATFPLEQTADAQRLNQEGHTRGKVIVTVG